MNIDHIHFYVEDARHWRDWFVQVLGFRSSTPRLSSHTQTEVVESGTVCFWLSSALNPDSPVTQYLQQHPPGVVDVAFQVDDPALLERGQIAGWGDLRHTLVAKKSRVEPPTTLIKAIDHLVLNVAKGELEEAIAYYETTFGFQRQQSFAIRTNRSALCSQVLTHPDSGIKLPINEPATPQSQVQEFLDWNRGAGVQHLALGTENIVAAIAQLRQQGLSFLPVPSTYYEELCQRQGFPLLEKELQAIARQEILVDWQADYTEALLLQAFTQPIFAQPTFFFELIERRTYWTGKKYETANGFGEANFQALFEAIEREQMKRGSLG
jgi:4-hydroxyphenylpyruvate dioxygenase